MSGNPAPLFHAVHCGPLGPVHLLASRAGLCRATLPRGPFEPERSSAVRRYPGLPIVDDEEQLAPFLRALDDFFDGREPDTDLPLDPGGTGFQRAVWETLRRVPRGEVVSYGELARQAGRPRAARAVGAACGANPLPLLVPCHRVIAAGGGLGGFGGGPELKRVLLEREGVRLG